MNIHSLAINTYCKYKRRSKSKNTENSKNNGYDQIGSDKKYIA